jgi:hypothetical protein
VELQGISPSERERRVLVPAWSETLWESGVIFFAQPHPKQAALRLLASVATP